MIKMLIWSNYKPNLSKEKYCENWQMKMLRPSHLLRGMNQTQLKLSYIVPYMVDLQTRLVKIKTLQRLPPGPTHLLRKWIIRGLHCHILLDCIFTLPRLPRPPAPATKLAWHICLHILLYDYSAIAWWAVWPLWSLSGGTDGWMECSEWLDQSYCMISADVGFLLVRLVECELPPIIYICA